MSTFEEDLGAALRLLVARCPRLTAGCYWAGTSAIALEELHHRQSFDLDFHTRRALVSVTPLLMEAEHVLRGRFELVTAPDEYGSSFEGLLTLDSGRLVTLEVLSNHEGVSPRMAGGVPGTDGGRAARPAGSSGISARSRLEIFHSATALWPLATKVRP